MFLDQFSALVAVALLACLSVFQGALIAGALLGRMAWGGQQRVLPAGLRIGSAASIGVYALCAYAALAKPGLVPPLVSNSITSVSMWVMTAFFAVGVRMNGISRSRAERLVMTPTTAALAAASLILAVR
jgi:hypothetical protein